MKKLAQILLIDDEKVSRSLNRMVVEELYLAELIIQCDNGQEALTMLLERKQKGIPLPDAILLDLYMPVMDGFLFMKQLKDNSLDFLLERTVVFTSSSEVGDKEEVRKIGARWYLTKPLLREMIFPALVTLIQERERSQRSYS